MPISRAWRCFKRESSCSCKANTSSRVAGVLETYAINKQTVDGKCVHHDSTY